MFSFSSLAGAFEAENRVPASTTNDKLAATAHLVIARIRPDELGAVKLNKILWFADCEHYRRHGRSLTGETEYIRKGQGPCPQRMEIALGSLKSRGKIAETRRPILNYTRREFTPLEEPDLSLFSAEEVDLILGIALEMAALTAKAASDLSHDDLWNATEPYGHMSVKAGSVQVLQATTEAIDWAREAFAAAE